MEIKAREEIKSDIRLYNWLKRNNLTRISRVRFSDLRLPARLCKSLYGRHYKENGGMNGVLP
jgi:hypothetical protein